MVNVGKYTIHGLILWVFGQVNHVKLFFGAFVFVCLQLSSGTTNIKIQTQPKIHTCIVYIVDVQGM